MRAAGLSAVLLLAAAAACGSSDGSAAEGPATRLTVTVWPRGPETGGARHWTLRCGPPGGTLPHPARACARLASLSNPFEPVPRDAVCTQIYGGPQVARVTGTFRRRRIDTRFRRTNGCEIARWNRVKLLFPDATGTSA